MNVHTYAWLAWLISGLVVLTTTRNPLIILLVDLILILFQVWITPPSRKILGTTLRFGLSVVVLSTVLNMFISRFGETILFSLPTKIPLLGGNYTLEALVYGLTNGLILIGMFTLFMILNQVVSVHSLVRLIPQAFHPVAVVTTIALTFIPASQKQFQAIREAQAIRGQQLKKLRDWLPLIIPLLIGGLERAMQIAEAMTARGFTAQSERKIPWFEKALLPLGLIFIILGWILELSTQLPLSGGWMILIGLLLLLILFFISGKKVKKSTYAQEPWTQISTWISLFALLLTMAFLINIPGYQSLAYEPYPKVQLPGFSIFHGLLTLTLLVPIFLMGEVKHDQD
jgi:energy-coupling factor transport system permease protein